MRYPEPIVFRCSCDEEAYPFTLHRCCSVQCGSCRTRYTLSLEGKLSTDRFAPIVRRGEPTPTVTNPTSYALNLEWPA